METSHTALDILALHNANFYKADCANAWLAAHHWRHESPGFSFKAKAHNGIAQHKSIQSLLFKYLTYCPSLAARRPQASIQDESARWHCAARREITRPKGGKLPKQKPCSPRGLVVVGKPMELSCGGSCWEPRELVEDGKPSGVIRGECRGGLGGAAAPNRPPSAARRAGGPN